MSKKPFEDPFPSLPRGGNLMRRMEQREPTTKPQKLAALKAAVAKVPAKKAAKKKGSRK